MLPEAALVKRHKIKAIDGHIEAHAATTPFSSTTSHAHHAASKSVLVRPRVNVHGYIASRAGWTRLLHHHHHHHHDQGRRGKYKILHIHHPHGTSSHLWVENGSGAVERLPWTELRTMFYDSDTKFSPPSLIVLYCPCSEHIGRTSKGSIRSSVYIYIYICVCLLSCEII